MKMFPFLNAYRMKEVIQTYKKKIQLKLNNQEIYTKQNLRERFISH